MPIHPSEPGTGVRLIDLDHREIAAMLEDVSHSLASGHSMQYIATLLSSLRQMTLTHFAFEESMMQATGYPKLALHLLEHQWLAEQAGSLISRARQRGLQGEDRLMQFFIKSHLSHIQFGDSQFGLWLNNTTLVPRTENVFSITHSPEA